MDSEREGYTFLWKIEHFNCAWHRRGEKIESPVFVLDSLERTKWRLCIFPKGDTTENCVAYYLKRHQESKGPNAIEIEYELSFLDENSTLQSTVVLKDSFMQGQAKGKRQFIKRDELFSSKDELRDTVTACCRIWVSGKRDLRSEVIYARTIINVENCSFAWNIENFSKMALLERGRAYEIQSTTLEDNLVTLELFLTGHCGEESINVCIKYHNPIVKFFRFNSFLQDEAGNRIDCGNLEFRVNDLKDGKLVLLVSKKMLMKKKNIYLPNDVLSLNCECDFSSKIAFEGIERIDHGTFTSIFRKKTKTENRLDDPSEGITDALRSMYLEELFCDAELRTPTKTFSAHKSILSARSPVFKAMFTNEMKEKIRELVEITDVDADTMHRILLYIYTDILEDLCLETASPLYEAADKYQILSLKSKCSAFLMANLTVNSVCEVLILADMHQDNHLKNTVQDYILQNDKTIFCSSEWKHLMDTHTKLAAETMYLKYHKD
ncbi:TD and POZ domain-containing protein 3 [Trichonephila clavipes]|uniref:TD and POZ domain-containing protein 3 n=1 Tax=Trichonephila clavipes TaxID=2585209 RepID=A0A8X6SAK8_TRICX|nr:TD and POZ domain-containing protein 3 [Trichonephila clavipes]